MNKDQREIGRIGVIGGGTMGIGIATAFLISGFPVTLIETEADAATRAGAAIKANLAGALKRGKLSERSHTKACAALECSADMQLLRIADVSLKP